MNFLMLKCFKFFNSNFFFYSQNHSYAIWHNLIGPHLFSIPLSIGDEIPTAASRDELSHVRGARLLGHLELGHEVSFKSWKMTRSFNFGLTKKFNLT